MKKIILVNGVLALTLLMSGCFYQVPWRMYQQQPPANLNIAPVQNGVTDQDPSVNNGDTNQDPISDAGVGIDEDYEEIIIAGTYIDNIDCGYINTKPCPDPETLYLVTDEEDLKAAEIALGMKIPDDPDWEWQYNSKHIDAFQNMIDKYPIDQYNYLFVYQEHACLGYKSHADAVVYKGQSIYFHYDMIKRPAEGEATCEAMDGEFKIAAIPKDFFDGKSFYNVIRTNTLVEYQPEQKHSNKF